MRVERNAEGPSEAALATDTEIRATPRVQVNETVSSRAEDDFSATLKGPKVAVNYNNIPLPNFVNEVFGEQLGLSFTLQPEIRKQQDLVTLRITDAVTPAELYRIARTTLSASGKPMRTQPPSVSVTGQPEQLKGVRRNMARVMADAHAKVVPTTLNDDADIHAWAPGNDVTGRLVRAICVAAKAVPALNAWFDGDNLTRTLHPQVDIGIAVDTDDGLFVPALRNADVLTPAGVREAVNRLRAQVQDRSIPSSELTGYTISLSNFGMFAGRYATPVVVPPCVAIVAAGRARHQITPVIGGFESHKVIPLSLTFDHRACTGGEAARFLRAMLDDLALPQ